MASHIKRIPNPQDIDIQALKAQVDIADVIGQFVPLKRAGGLLRGLCPFHQESVPSFTVYDNSWYCFGACRQGGDSISFVQKKLRLSFPQALEWLKERVGTFEAIAPTVPIQRALVPVIPEIVEYFRSMLKPEHREYYHSRLFTDATIDRELWGFDGRRYAIPVWSGKPQESECLGIRLRKKDGDGPKYLGIRGSNNPVLYNVWSLVGETGAFIFFGEFDAALACQDGFPACSPTNGCAVWDNSWDDHFGDKDAIVIVPDRGEERFANALAEHLGLNRTRVCSIPAFMGKDYSEWRIVYGGTPSDLLLALKYQTEQQTVSFDF